MDFIRECLAQLKMRLRLDTAMVEKLQELEDRVYALEEHTKLLKAHDQVTDERLGKLTLVVQNERKSAPAAVVAPAKNGY